MSVFCSIASPSAFIYSLMFRADFYLWRNPFIHGALLLSCGGEAEERILGEFGWDEDFTELRFLIAFTAAADSYRETWESGKISRRTSARVVSLCSATGETYLDPATFYYSWDFLWKVAIRGRENYICIMSEETD